MKKILLTALVCCLPLSAWAFYDPDERAQADLQRLDIDGDKVVSKQEYLLPFTLRLNKYDADGNGRVMMDELQVYWKRKTKTVAKANYKAKQFMGVYDKNKDGSVVHSEFTTRYTARFVALDSNGDQKISLAEFQEHWRIEKESYEKWEKRNAERNDD